MFAGVQQRALKQFSHAAVETDLARQAGEHCEGFRENNAAVTSNLYCISKVI